MTPPQPDVDDEDESQQPTDTDIEDEHGETDSEYATAEETQEHIPDEEVTSNRTKYKIYQTKTMKRVEKQIYAQKWGFDVSLDGGADRIKQMQMEDDSLSAARESTVRRNSGHKNSLLYRRTHLPGQSDTPLNQLVLTGSKYSGWPTLPPWQAILEYTRRHLPLSRGFSGRE